MGAARAAEQGAVRPEETLSAWCSMPARTGSRSQEAIALDDLRARGAGCGAAYLRAGAHGHSATLLVAAIGVRTRIIGHEASRRTQDPHRAAGGSAWASAFAAAHRAGAAETLVRSARAGRLVDLRRSGYLCVPATASPGASARRWPSRHTRPWQLPGFAIAAGWTTPRGSRSAERSGRQRASPR